MLAGPRYLIDCIENAAIRRLREETYRGYVSDCLYTICAWSGNKLRKRYFDLVNPDAEPVDNRSGEEIAKERLERFGIKVVNDNGPDEPDRIDQS